MIFTLVQKESMVKEDVTSLLIPSSVAKHLLSTR